MKRIFDIFTGTFLLVLLVVPMFLIFVSIYLSSGGPALYWSDRVGKNNKIFKMPKFRSMLVDMPDVATHLLVNPGEYLSPIGGFLRSTSLDELPQLFSVIKGDMSIVGPRPALPSQRNLITYRRKSKVFLFRPGLTGLAQILSYDGMKDNVKARDDTKYVNSISLKTDLIIILKTFNYLLKPPPIY